MSIHCLANSLTRQLVEYLRFGLRAELDLTPKPGLVDR